jgi:hypothetical protein
MNIRVRRASFFLTNTFEAFKWIAAILNIAKPPAYSGGHRIFQNTSTRFIFDCCPDFMYSYYFQQMHRIYETGKNNKYF